MDADFPAPIRAIRENQRRTNEELGSIPIAIAITIATLPENSAPLREKIPTFAVK